MICYVLVMGWSRLVLVRLATVDSWVGRLVWKFQQVSGRVLGFYLDVIWFSYVLVSNGLILVILAKFWVECKGYEL